MFRSIGKYLYCKSALYFGIRVDSKQQSTKRSAVRCFLIRYTVRRRKRAAKRRRQVSVRDAEAVCR